jgi:hypothetical protein
VCIVVISLAFALTFHNCVASKSSPNRHVFRNAVQVRELERLYNGLHGDVESLLMQAPASVAEQLAQQLAQVQEEMEDQVCVTSSAAGYKHTSPCRAPTGVPEQV